MDQGYFLAIAGNIGAGKTELTRRLSEELGDQYRFALKHMESLETR